MPPSQRLKPLRMMIGGIKTPPLSKEARFEAGKLLGRIQNGDIIGLPHSRPMPEIGNNVHELRINDEHETFRIIYRIDSDAILIVEMFSKKSQETSQQVIDTCKIRLKRYDTR